MNHETESYFNQCVQTINHACRKLDRNEYTELLEQVQAEAEARLQALQDDREASEAAQ